VSGRDLSRASLALGAVGLVLIAFETVQSMRGVAINALGTTLIFVGVGLFVIAAVLIVVGLTSVTGGESVVDGDEAAQETLHA
jgi:hypothetical protein